MDMQRIQDPNPTRIKDLRDPEPITASFRLHTNGHGPNQLVVSDIEMLAIQSVTYTSLRDLLPTTTSTSSIMSPIHNSSWHELPIKNPLVKQAALSYLLPMSAPPEAGDKGVLGRLRDACTWESCGCFEWLDGVVLYRVKRAFGIHVDHQEQSDNDDKERHEDEEKVEW